jgi:hypothetical protein
MAGADDPAGGSLVVAITRAVIMAIVVAGLIVFGLPAVLALGATHL